MNKPGIWGALAMGGSLSLQSLEQIEPNQNDFKNRGGINCVCNIRASVHNEGWIIEIYMYIWPRKPKYIYCRCGRHACRSEKAVP